MTGPPGNPTPDTAGVIAPPPLVFLAGLAAGFGLDAALPSASLPGAVRWPVGIVLALAGLALMSSFLAAFRSRQTAVRPDRPTTAIVSEGPYRATRNPAYLGMALLYAGIAVMTSALWAFATLVPTLIVIDRAVIAREERYLERKFGEDYLRYKRGVRRWL
jgi:protein-S-isoprenylcysteine O-methyltransferase Ste14